MEAPRFDEAGRALSREDQIKIARRKGVCVNCGVKTVQLRMLAALSPIPLTNEFVYKGICIKCNRDKVPSDVVQRYDRRHVRRVVTTVAAAIVDPRSGGPNPAPTSSAAQGPRKTRPRATTTGRPSPSQPRVANNNRPSGITATTVASSSVGGRSGSDSRYRAAGAAPPPPRNNPHHTTRRATPPMTNDRDQRGRRTRSSDPNDTSHRPLAPQSQNNRPGIFSSDSAIDFKNAFYLTLGTQQNVEEQSTMSSVTHGSSLATTRIDYSFRDLREDDKQDLQAALSDARNDDNVTKMKSILHYIRNVGMDSQDIKTTEQMIVQIIIIIDGILEDYDDQVLFGLACAALLRLSASSFDNRDEDLKVVIADRTQVLHVVLNRLRSQEDEDPLGQDACEWALALLESLAILPENKTLILLQKGVVSILNALQEHSKSLPTLFWCTRLLYNLLCKDGRERRIVFALEEADAIPILVGAIHTSSTSEDAREEVVQLLAARLLWRLLQYNEDPKFPKTILDCLSHKDTSFLPPYVKITKNYFSSNLFTMATEHVMATDLVCSILAASSENNASDSRPALFRAASEATTPILRIMKDYATNEQPQDVVEVYCRFLSMLICNHDSREAVLSAGGLQAIFDALENQTKDESILESAVWALCHTLPHSNHSVNTNHVRILRKVFKNKTVEDQLHLFQPLCNITANMCLIPETTSKDIFINEIKEMKLKMKEQKPEDQQPLDEFAKATFNLFVRFPEEVNSLDGVNSLEGFASTVTTILHSPQLDRNLCNVLGDMSAKSSAIQRELTSIDSLTFMLENLRSSKSVETTEALVKLLIQLITTNSQKNVQLPENMFPVILDVFERHPNNDIQLDCLKLISDSLMVATTCPPVALGNLVSLVVDCLSNHSVTVLRKIQGCTIAWVITSRFIVNATALHRFFMAFLSILISMKDQRIAFNYDLFLTSAAALASVTAAMRTVDQSFSTIPSIEDIDQFLSLPYCAHELAPGKIEPYVRLLDCIYSLCWVDHDKIIQCGGLLVVIDIMAEFRNCVEIQQFGCAILAVLSAIESLQVALSIVQTDGIDMILQALSVHSTDTVLRCQGVKALAHLSHVDPEFRLIITSLGGFNAILNAMQSSMQDDELVKAALSSLQNLSADADVAVLTTAGILPVVLKAMNDFSQDVQVQESGLGVLQNMSMRWQESKRLIAEAQGIPLVANALREFLGIPTLVENAFTTLWSLASVDANQKIIADMDILSLVLDGMMLLLGHVRVVLQGCGCLCTLAADSTNKSIIQHAGGVDILVFAMWAHHSTEEVQVEACRTIASLAVDSRTKEVIVVGETEIKAIVSAMRRFPASENLQEQACLVLRNFLFSPENIPVMVGFAREIKELVTHAAMHFPKACESRGQQILDCMKEVYV